MYETAFVKSEDAISLLQSCGQIHQDSLPTLYHSPARFKSQAHLFSWLARSTDENLRSITRLTLGLTDIDLTTLFTNRTVSPGAPRPTPQSLSDDVLQKLCDAFRRLPNLISLTIIPEDRASPAFSGRLYRPLLSAIPGLCPQLHTLELHDRQELLDDVQALQRIPEVRFTAGMRRTHHAGLEDWMKMNAVPATIDFNHMLDVVHPGRRALSEPVTSPSLRALEGPRSMEWGVRIKRETGW